MSDQQCFPKLEPVSPADTAADIQHLEEMIDTNSTVSGTSFDATFATKTWREDASLIVEGKELFVSSSMLSLMSPVLGKLIEEKMASGDPLKFELENKNTSDVLEFLKCIYPNILKKVKLDNVFVVLPLAVEFEVKELTKRCENVLLENIVHLTDTKILLQYLSKAFTYNLTELKRMCINAAVEKSCQDLREAAKKVRLPPQVNVEVQNIVIDSMNTQMAEQQALIARHQQLAATQQKSINDLKEENDDLKQDAKMYDNICKSTDLAGILMEYEDAPASLPKPRVAYVERIFSLDGRRTIHKRSKRVEVHGVLWHLQAIVQDEKLGLYLQADQPEQHCHHSWQCEAYLTLRLHNYKNEKDSIRKSLFHKYTKAEGFGNPELAKMVEIERLDSGFMNDKNEIKVEVIFIAGEPTLA